MPADLRPAKHIHMEPISTKPCSPIGLHTHEADSCHVGACVGKADGWGERACAAALSVGLIFW